MTTWIVVLYLANGLTLEHRRPFVDRQRCEIVATIAGERYRLRRATAPGLARLPELAYATCEGRAPKLKEHQ